MKNKTYSYINDVFKASGEKKQEIAMETERFQKYMELEIEINNWVIRIHSQLNNHPVYETKDVMNIAKADRAYFINKINEI